MAISVFFLGQFSDENVWDDFYYLFMYLNFSLSDCTMSKLHILYIINDITH